MLYIPTFIEQQLKKAHYEYDQVTKSWCAWAPNLPGALAQADSVEEARTQLGEVIEDYLIVAFEKKKTKQIFRQLKKSYAAFASLA